MPDPSTDALRFTEILQLLQIRAQTHNCPLDIEEALDALTEGRLREILAANEATP